jgi:phospholipase C
MNPTDRRSFFKLLGAGTLGAAMPGSIAKAMALPANNQTGTIQDVEHIVVLMQENRSFDHYFGTLQGVRGFSDPRAMRLPSGLPVWYQPDGSSYVLPFHPPAPDMGLQFLVDLPHDWQSTHLAWNEGRWDAWVPNKGTTTMAYMTREDIPFHYALADAFTICDAYHCSILAATDPNRYYMWTGWVGNDGSGGGPVLDNAEAGYGWQTYPERLEAAGISWKIYQDIGLGLTAAEYWGWTTDAYIGNYGDNSLLYFHQYQNAAAGTPLANNAKTGTNIAVSGTLFDQFRQDVANGTLPQVSWIVAPEAYTEHPNWPANYGAWYVSQMLDILTSNPDVWSKTVFLVTYDENDGFFDHMVSPTPPISDAYGASTVSIANEIFPGNSEYMAGPYGFGPRVPMLIISPWSKGGYVNSQLFDHTSIIRFIEQRFGPNNQALSEPNITPWRRTVSGDLTSAFNFCNPNDVLAALPSTAAYQPPDALRHPSYTPVPPTAQAMPQQEPGIRRARALPYAMQVQGGVDFGGGQFDILFGNTGTAGIVYQVRAGQTDDAPRSYTVEPGKSLTGSWQPAGNGHYDLYVHGPNGFLRTFHGNISAAAGVDVVIQGYDDAENETLVLDITNRGTVDLWLAIEDVYNGKQERFLLRGRAPGFWAQAVNWVLPVSRRHGWYDIVLSVVENGAFKWRLAGHVETGRDSFTDPALGAATQA